MPSMTRSSSDITGRLYSSTGSSYTDVWSTSSSLSKVKSLTSGHFGFPDFPRDRNCGGPFTLYGTETNWGYSEYASIHPYPDSPTLKNQRFDGQLKVDISPLGTPSLVDSNGMGWGTQAYREMKPTQPSFAGLNAFYELKDVPDMLRQRFLKDGLKSIGNYYLALKFGWEPLLKDVRNLVLTQRQAQRILGHLLRNNGKPVRRRVILKDATSDAVESTGSSYGAFAPTLVTNSYISIPTYIRREWSTDRVWASARFRYWLPPGPQDVQWTKAMIARIYGLNPSPYMVYNAIPWSWLVDWFTNLGDLIENLSPGVADRCAADYLYVMRQKETIRTQYSRGRFRGAAGVPNFTLEGTSTSRAFVKTRVMGNPFGFGANPNDLTGTQWAILGALGLSRL